MITIALAITIFWMLSRNKLVDWKIVIWEVIRKLIARIGKAKLYQSALFFSTYITI